MQKYDFIKSTFNFSNAPIKRFVKIEKKEDLLKKLKNEISSIENCTLKNNSNNLVFADGNHDSSIMLIGEGPGPFIKKHISIINPKLIILLGSTAMEAFFGNKEKISKSRGFWKELIVNNKTYLTMVTFHPAYLLRQPDQKKFSWADLKEIKNKIEELKIEV